MAQPNRILSTALLAALAGAAASCASTTPTPRATQWSVEREGEHWVAAGRVRGDTAAHDASRDLAVELCDAHGRALVTASARAAVDASVRPRTASGWDGSFRVVLPSLAAFERGAVSTLRLRSVRAR